jgi:hypothetical protein
VDDYAAWVVRGYLDAQGADGEVTVFFGLAQRVNQIAYAVKHFDLQLRFEGVYAKEAEHFMRPFLQ